MEVPVIPWNCKQEEGAWSSRTITNRSKLLEPKLIASEYASSADSAAQLSAASVPWPIAEPKAALVLGLWIWSRYPDLSRCWAGRGGVPNETIVLVHVKDGGCRIGVGEPAHLP